MLGTGWEYAVGSVVVGSVVVGCVVVGSVVVAGLYRYPGRAVQGQDVVWHETTLLSSSTWTFAFLIKSSPCLRHEKNPTGIIG